MAEFELGYNATTGADRKRLVQAISEIRGAKATYLGMPSAAYRLENITVTKSGSVLFDEGVDTEEIVRIEKQLEMKGFEAEYGSPYMEPPVIDEPEPLEDCPPPYGVREQTGLTVSIPLDKVNVGNLTNLLDAKGTLIQKALGIATTPIEIHEDCVSFPGLTRCHRRRRSMPTVPSSVSCAP